MLREPEVPIGNSGFDSRADPSMSSGARLMTSVAIAVAVLALATVSASAQTLDELKNDGKNTDNVLTYGMGYQQHRYSPLKQIDKTNVKRLVPSGI